MAYHYVKYGLGTNAGDTSYSTMRTGAFGSGDLVAANVYADLETCFANATIVDGDYILCSDAHDYDETLLNSEFGLSLIDITVNVISVSDTNADAYSKGALESTGPSHADIYFRGAACRTNYRGMVFETNDNIHIQDLGMHVYFNDCDLIFTNTSPADEIIFNADGQKFEMKDCSLKFGASGQSFQITESHIYLDGVYGASGTVKILQLIECLNSSGGFHVEIINSDLDSIMATDSDLFLGLNLNQEQFKIRIHNCKLPTGFTINNGVTIPNPHYDIEMSSCDQGDGYHYFYHANKVGHAEEDTAQYLNATYDGTNGFSAQIDTEAECNDVKPYSFKIGTIPATDLSTANQTVSIELVGPAGLTDSDVWIEVEAQDDTDQSLGVIVSTRNVTKIGAGNGTALTSSSEVWNVTTDTEYSISVDLGAYTNVDNTNVSVYAVVAKPSITVNFDMPTIAATA